MRGTLGGILGEWGPLLLDLGDGTPDGTFAGFPLPPALINTGTDVNTGSPVPSDLHKTFAEYDPTYKADETVATLEFSHDFGPMTLTTVGGLPGDELPVADRLQLDRRRPAVQRPGGRRRSAAASRSARSTRGAARLAQRQRPRRRRVLAQLRPVGPGSRPVVGRGAPVLRVRRAVEFPGRRCSTSTRDDNTNYYVVTSELDYWAQVTRAVHAVPELGAAVLHQRDAERLAEVERSVRRAVLGRDRDVQVDRGPALHARRERREGPADAVLGAGGHAADRDRSSTTSASTRPRSTSSPAASASTGSRAGSTTRRCTRSTRAATRPAASIRRSIAACRSSRARRRSTIRSSSTPSRSARRTCSRAAACRRT